MTSGGPAHFATVAWPLVHALKPKPRTEPNMIADPILNARPGVTTHRQRFVRAFLPDGRTSDSRPAEVPEPDTAAARAAKLNEIVAAFGRRTFPEGTRFEAMERTVTVTATEWAPAARAEAAT